MNIIQANVNRFHKVKREFEATFGRALKDFMDVSTIQGIALGFDIIGFDEWLEVPEGTSTKDFINKKYGEEAVKIIEGLL